MSRTIGSSAGARPSARPRISLGGKLVVGNQGELTLALQCLNDGIKPIVQNYRFHPDRKYEIDIAVPHLMVGVEINGGVANGKAHGSVAGILRDMDKSNLLVLAGWRVLRYTPTEVHCGVALAGLKALILAVARS